MFRTLLVACTLLLSFQANAQSHFFESPEEGRKAFEGIVASVAAGNSVGAVKELRALSVVSKKELDTFEETFQTQQVNILLQFGPALDYEFLREDRLGAHLIRYRYLVRYEKSPIRWTFVLYKAEKGWIMSHFLIDTDARLFFTGG